MSVAAATRLLTKLETGTIISMPVLVDMVFTKYSVGSTQVPGDSALAQRIGSYAGTVSPGVLGEVIGRWPVGNGVVPPLAVYYV